MLMVIRYARRITAIETRQHSSRDCPPLANHGDRKGLVPDSIILHYTGIATGAAALDHLCTEASQVSAHYLVDEYGEIFQLVPEERRAWHAGIGVWAGNRDMNTVSIGIEIANYGHIGGLPPYLGVQIDTVVALCQDISDALADFAGADSRAFRSGARP